jgi:hypothetical protein
MGGTSTEPNDTSGMHGMQNNTTNPCGPNATGTQQPSGKSGTENPPINQNC